MRVAGARKTGRNPKLPHVPVIIIKHGPRNIESQILGFAFSTRAEAIAFAQQTIDLNNRKIERR